MVDKLSLQQEVPAGQKVVADVVLRGADCGAVTDAQRAQDVQHLGVAAVLLQQGDDDFDVLLLRHMHRVTSILGYKRNEMFQYRDSNFCAIAHHSNVVVKAIQD